MKEPLSFIDAFLEDVFKGFSLLVYDLGLYMLSVLWLSI
jgi:hypothetical protein